MIASISILFRFRSIDNPVWEEGELALVDIACDSWVHLRVTANSVEGIFQNVEKPPVEALLSFRIEPCCSSDLESCFPMPPELH